MNMPLGQPRTPSRTLRPLDAHHSLFGLIQKYNSTTKLHQGPTIVPDNLENTPDIILRYMAQLMNNINIVHVWGYIWN